MIVGMIAVVFRSL